FTRPELESGSAVAVVDQDVARTLFGRVDPVGKVVGIGGRAARVIGVYLPPANICNPPGQYTGAIVPYLMLDHQLPFDRTNALFIVVKPRANVTVSDAEEAVMVTLRRMRHLHP